MTDGTTVRPGYLPGLTPAEAVAAALAEVADDEEVAFNEQKARAIIERTDTSLGPWEASWSAREILPLINRLRQAERRCCGAVWGNVEAHRRSLAHFEAQQLYAKEGRYF